MSGHAFRRLLARHRGALLMVGIAVLAFGVGFAVFDLVLMPRFVHGNGEVEVPDLAGLGVDQAERTLLASGLTLSRAGERFDPSVPRGEVVQQDPPAGTPVRGHARVLVTVSLGEESSSVPESFGESRRSAELLLERAGLVVGAVAHAPSDEVGEGLVVASDPPAESVLPRGTEVALLVSTGAGPEAYVMPDLAGREIGNCRRQFEALGFKVSTPPAAPAIGAITAQSPSPGSRLTRETPIELQGSSRVIR